MIEFKAKKNLKQTTNKTKWTREMKCWKPTFLIIFVFCAILFWNCHHKWGARLLQWYFWCSQSLNFDTFDTNSTLLHFSIHYLFMWFRIEYWIFFFGYPIFSHSRCGNQLFLFISFHSINMYIGIWLAIEP